MQACEKTVLQTKFAEYLSRLDPERDTSSVKPEEALFYLQDLAARRNQVAHGVLPDDLLSTELLTSYIDFFEAFGHGLYQVCQLEVLPYIVDHQAIPLGTPSDVFLKGEVVCIPISDMTLKVGDAIVARSGDGKTLQVGWIKEMQLADTSHDEIVISNEVEVGLHLTFKSKKSHAFFLPKVSLTNLVY